MNDNKNTILAIVLSEIVLIGWQYFFAGPQEKARQQQLQAQRQKQKLPAPRQPWRQRSPAGPPHVAGQPTAPAHAAPVDRAAALSGSPRVPSATGSLQGSIALKGGRIDDLALVKCR